MYYIASLGYECFPEFQTKKEALETMKVWIDDDMKKSSYKLTKIKHSKTSVELKIGGKQGFHAYSYYTVGKV